MRRNLLANFAGQGVTVLMNLAFIPVYLRFLGIEAFGLIGIFTVVLTCAMLLDGGLTPTLNREMARFRAGGRSIETTADLLRSVEWLGVVIVALFCLAGLAFSTWLANNWVASTAIDRDVVARALLLMAAAASLRVLEGVFRGALLGLDRAVAMNVLAAASVTLRAGGAAVLLAIGPRTAEAFFLWQAGASLVSTLAFAACVHHVLPRPDRPPKAGMRPLQEIGRFAGGVFGTGLLSLLLTQIDKILLVRLIPLDAFGHYALAAALAAGLYQLSGPVSQSYYPRLTELFERSDIPRLASEYHKGSQVVALLVAPVAMMLAAFPTTVLEIWTADPLVAAQAGPILAILAVGTMLHCLMYIPYMLQLAGGWASFAMRINFAAVLVLVPALFLIVPAHGAIGAASVWLALNTAYVTISIHLMHRRLLPGERRAWYGRDVLPPIAAAAATALLLRWVMPVGLNWAASVAYVGAAGCAALTAACLASPITSTWRRGQFDKLLRPRG